eukprot:c36867_g1_i1 orf=140-433(+)
MASIVWRLLSTLLLLSLLIDVGEGRERLLQINSSEEMIEGGILLVEKFEAMASRRTLGVYSKEGIQSRFLIVDTNADEGDYSPTANSDFSPTPPFSP